MDERHLLDPEIDPAMYRRVLGHVPTGVVVVTAATGEPVGMACNSFASVSLAPPLVLFCAARSSETWPQIRAAGRFCVNVMASHHEDATRAFARKGIDRFQGIAWHERPGGPGIDDAVAWVDCELHAEHDAGDHVIVVGAVRRLEARQDADALVFWRGAYGAFRSPDPGR